MWFALKRVAMDSTVNENFHGNDHGDHNELHIENMHFQHIHSGAHPGAVASTAHCSRRMRKDARRT